MTNSIHITTVSKPKIGNCIIQPQLGLAGKTLFNISCAGFRNENNMKNIFEYYQNNKNDETTMGNMLFKLNFIF